MKARGGFTYVPSGHDAIGSTFYAATPIISVPNGAVEKGDWTPNPNQFSPEAPRTAAQCNHVDGSTMGK
jgi:hypothetical protein